VLILHIDEFTFSTPALIELFCILIDWVQILTN
jgi:hypothetical protein